MDHFTYELGTEKGGTENRLPAAGRRITLPGSPCAVTEARASAADAQVKPLRKAKSERQPLRHVHCKSVDVLMLRRIVTFIHAFSIAVPHE